MAGTNLINAESISKGYGTRILLDEVTLGLGTGDVVGVVGRNGDGKSTLLGVLTGSVEPDSGRVTRANGASIGVLTQVERTEAGHTVRDLIVGGEADHTWAADARSRRIVEQLLAGIDLDADAGRLSGGERRRVALVAMLLGHHDLLVLDEPTNHLDVEAVAWLAEYLRELQSRGVAMLVVSHDRWFLDAVCTRIWEVHDGVVDPYDGGYAAYVLARAERARQAASTEARRKNLLRKELAWLRRGAPARTSKPKFRIDAATVLIADEPEPRDRLALAQFATARLGKDVIDAENVVVDLPATPAGAGRRLIDHLTWSVGPGDRIGLVGVNGSGKTTLLNLFAGDSAPTSGRVKQGKTLRLGHLSQRVGELDDSERVLESVTRLRNQTKLATGRESSASNLLEDFGFTGDKLVTRIGELSGGERRRLQLLRLLISEPNVLLLDEPTNDLDIDTLTVVEDFLDSWPGTLVVVSHDRYFLERVCDVTYALMGDGRCVMLPGGVEQYLEHRRSMPDADRAPAAPPLSERSDTSRPLSERSDTSRPLSERSESKGPSALPTARLRELRKEVARIEGQLGKLETRIARVHDQMAQSASDYGKLAALQAELGELETQKSELEDAWLAASEHL